MRRQLGFSAGSLEEDEDAADEEESDSDDDSSQPDTARIARQVLRDVFVVFVVVCKHDVSGHVT